MPVLIFVVKFELTFKLTVPFSTLSPDDPVSNPKEDMVPEPVVEIFPLVVNPSPVLRGESVEPVRFQNPMFPVAGAVVVRNLLPSV